MRDDNIDPTLTSKHAMKTGRATRWDDLDEPSAASQQLAADINTWPSYSPKRFEYGLAQIDRVRSELDALERQLVDDAHEQRFTWEQIAKWLGTTRQAAHKRFSDRSES
jgi:hypothetical protein